MAFIKIPSDRIFCYHFCRHFVDGLLCLPSRLAESQFSSPEVVSTWNQISVIVANVEKQKSLLPEGQDSPVLDVFQKLFLVMAFQVGNASCW